MEMKEQLRLTPCIVEIPENYRALWELCLGDIWYPASVEEWRERIDSVEEINPDPTLFINPSPSDAEELTQVFGFPTLELPLLPTIAQVNEALPERFEANSLFKQSNVASRITEQIDQELPQIAALLVFDGLSFYDVKDWEVPNATLEPCLVDGLSVTDEAMRRLIGDPVLTHRLFPLGYSVRLGFSYWERSSNALTDKLFHQFPPNQLHRVTTANEVLETISTAPWSTRTYVQVIRTGLDNICHSHRESPNRKNLLDGLKEDVIALIAALEETGKSFRLFITADHGILWDDEGNKLDILPLAREKYKARYTEGEVATGKGTLTLNTDDGIYTVLTGDKVITRNRKSTEWGFHGGISAQESLVPFWNVRQ